MFQMVAAVAPRPLRHPVRTSRTNRPKRRVPKVRKTVKDTRIQGKAPKTRAAPRTVVKDRRTEKAPKTKTQTARTNLARTLPVRILRAVRTKAQKVQERARKTVKPRTVPNRKRDPTRIVPRGIKIKDQSRRKELGLQDVSSKGPKSADHLAAGLTAENLQDLEQSNKEVEQILGLSVGWEQGDGVQMRAGPRDTTAKLASARQAGKGLEVTAFLEQRELELKIET